MRCGRSTVREAAVVACLGLLAVACGSGEREASEPALASRTAQVGPEAVEGHTRTDPGVETGTRDEGVAPSSLRWEERAVERSIGDCDGEPCARIRLAYPDFTAGAPEAVLERIDRTVISWLASEALGGVSDRDLPAPPPPGTEEPAEPQTDPLVGRAEAFLGEYERFREAVPSPTSPWWVGVQATVDARVGRVLTLRVDTESYTGGAHGLALRVYWLFDLGTGEVLGLDDLVVEEKREELRRVVEARFREVRDLAPDEDLEEAGFFVESGNLPLTGNVAVGRDGLTFQYHPYEVAPYVAGPTTVPVPWAELDGLVKVPR